MTAPPRFPRLVGLAPPGAWWQHGASWLRPRRRRLETSRARWGRPADAPARGSSRYFELIRGRPGTAIVDDRTWADLEFPALFRRMDATLTAIGSQVLYASLRCPSADPGAAAERYAVYRTLRADAGLREAVQMRLLRLADDGHAGASTAHNAIRLLQRLDFPQDITATALRYARDAPAPGSGPD